MKVLYMKKSISGFLTIFLFLIINFPVFGQTQFVARLSGSNEVPSVNSMGKGMITVTLKGNQIKVTGHFSGLESDYLASHIHLGRAGSNGKPVFVLKPDINRNKRSGSYDAAKNTFTITQQEIKTLKTAGMYVNVHSTDNRSGELRGQLLAVAHVYMARLSGDNEVPPVQTNAKGWVKVILNGDHIRVNGMFYGLSSDYYASHIHEGEAGTNGKVVFVLNPKLNGDNKSGTYIVGNNTFKLTPEQIAKLEAGKFYINIHSKDHAAGELRGQLMELVASSIRVE